MERAISLGAVGDLCGRSDRLPLGTLMHESRPCVGDVEADAGGVTMNANRVSLSVSDQESGFSVFRHAVGEAVLDDGVVLLVERGHVDDVFGVVGDGSVAE